MPRMTYDLARHDLLTNGYSFDARRPPQPDLSAPRLMHTMAAHDAAPPLEAARSDQGITCLASGTMVVTIRGELPVETLQAGEVMLTMHGAPARQPLLRVARSRVEPSRQDDPSPLAPIRIRAGALMHGAPIRDLRVSPGQGIFLDNHLVPARLLVNGTSIFQDNADDGVTYHYLWFDEHDLVIADGALTESSFVDDRQRIPDDAANITAITNDAASRTRGRLPEARCAPLLVDGPNLAAIRHRIALRADSVALR